MREKILSVLDAITLRLLTRKFVLFGGAVTYQDLPWVKISGSRRAVGSRERFEAMEGDLARKGLRPKVVLDVGCNVGYFSLSFASMGCISYGVEMGDVELRTAQIAAKKVYSGYFVPVRMECRRESAALLPASDVTLCLSIWHHWVRHLGLEEATDILKRLWESTRGVLYFDTGESEMPKSYGLPFGAADPVAWLTAYLEDVLDQGTVETIGRFKAFAPGGAEGDKDVRRTLFAVSRRS